MSSQLEPFITAYGTRKIETGGSPNRPGFGTNLVVLWTMEPWLVLQRHGRILDISAGLEFVMSQMCRGGQDSRFRTTCS